MGVNFLDRFKTTFFHLVFAGRSDIGINIGHRLLAQRAVRGGTHARFYSAPNAFNGSRGISSRRGSGRRSASDRVTAGRRIARYFSRLPDHHHTNVPFRRGSAN